MKQFKSIHNAKKNIDPLMKAITDAKVDNEIDEVLVRMYKETDKPNKKLIYFSGYGSLNYYALSNYPIHYAMAEKKQGVVKQLLALELRDCADPDGHDIYYAAIKHGMSQEILDTISNKGLITNNDLFAVAALTNKNYFNHLHELIFGISFDDLIKKPINEMNPMDYLTKISADPVFKKRLKSIYLDIIKHNPEYLSILKMETMLGLKPPVIEFLRLGKSSAANKDTASYHDLTKMLRKHVLNNDDLNRIRKKLILDIDNVDAYIPNPALAALYFSHRACGDADYELLEKNLLITPKSQGQAYSPKMKLSLDHLIEQHLSADELAALKKNLFSAIEFNQDLKINGDASTPCPFTEIIERQTHHPKVRAATSTRMQVDSLGFFARGRASKPDEMVHGEAYKDGSDTYYPGRNDRK